MDCISGERYLSFVMVFGKNLIFDKAHVRAQREDCEFNAMMARGRSAWQSDEDEKGLENGFLVSFWL
jgi:hypothetical protein